MKLYSWFYDQEVTNAELIAGFVAADDAEHQVFTDLDLIGIFDGGEVTEAAVPNLTVDVAGVTGRSPTGQRLRKGASSNVNCAVDVNSVSTAVVGVANSKILSILMKLVRVETDPRIDGNNVTVQFDQAEGLELYVIQGAEAPVPVGPAIPSDSILLADVTRIFGQTQIFNASIALTGRRQDAFIFNGFDVVMRQGTPKEAIDSLAQVLDDHIGGGAYLHGAGAINKDAGEVFPDATAVVPASDLETWLATLQTRYQAHASSNDGAAKIGAFTIPGGGGDPYSITLPLHVRGALAQLLVHLNGHATIVGSAHLASQINYAGGAAWLDATANPAATVEAQLDKFITDLIANAAAARIGMAATPGAALPAGALQTALNLIDTTGVFRNRTQSWTAKQNWAIPSDAIPLRETTVLPSTSIDFKLMDQFLSGLGVSNIYVRIYVIATGFVITNNAVWNSAANTWLYDDSTSPATTFRVTYDGLEYRRRVSAGGAWADNGWSQTMSLATPFTVSNLDASGEWNSQGNVSVIAGIQAAGGSGLTAVMATGNYRKKFIIAPSTVTWTVLSSAGTSGVPTNVVLASMALLGAAFTIGNGAAAGSGVHVIARGDTV